MVADCNSFADGLRAVPREDPDVLLIGEMRDPRGSQAALTIAETGHLVFATLHTNDTAQTFDRIVDVFLAERQPQIRLQLAHTLAGVLHQILVPRIGGGRVAAFHVLNATQAVRNPCARARRAGSATSSRRSARGDADARGVAERARALRAHHVQGGRRAQPRSDEIGRPAPEPVEPAP